MTGAGNVGTVFPNYVYSFVSNHIHHLKTLAFSYVVWLLYKNPYRCLSLQSVSQTMRRLYTKQKSNFNYRIQSGSIKFYGTFYTTNSSYSDAFLIQKCYLALE